MQTFLEEIVQQPEALYTLLRSYNETAIEGVRIHINGSPLLFTGMGASYNAGEIISYNFQAKKHPATICQAVDLLNYKYSTGHDHVMIYISQSGDSAEVAPLLENRTGNGKNIGVTNNPESTLGRLATLTLPIFAGQEETVATKTYLNTLALLNLICGTPHEILHRLVERIQTLIQANEQTSSLWQQAISSPNMLYLVGHGPHAVTARQVSMMCAEWLKRPSIGMSIGAFRHGTIESVQAESTVIIFAPWGATRSSALALADELTRYGATVLIVEHGQTRLHTEGAYTPLVEDEFLAPLLDIIPAQLATEAVARTSGMVQGFRYISKIVSRL